MLTPILFLRLSVALLVLGIGALWARSWNAPRWDPQAEWAFPRLGIARKDGHADLSGVELEIFTRRLLRTIVVHGDGTGTHMQEGGHGSYREVAFVVPREQVESWLAELEALDFRVPPHECTHSFQMHNERTFYVTIGNRRTRFLDQIAAYRDPSASEFERGWHGRLDALYRRMHTELNIPR